MFDAFDVVFLPDEGKKEVIQPILTTKNLVDDNLVELFSRHGGQSFNQGLYRIIPLDEISHWNGLVLSAFPSFSGRITCFGIDWLGRVFALDSGRLEDGRPGVVMFQPGTAEALEIPCNVRSFHESELLQYREEALAESFYKQWISQAGVPPKVTQCIGYKKPLFLGGSDTVGNLEVSDLDVYWSIAVQLIQQIRGMPLGTPISKISLN